ncbi:hypothetical protein BRADI_4g24655v3 [Brachypodium distachyon]|uniref:Uncharacterized protein n=1 Tax=Brachypodium distachyon TaxID=15368 RepID=A0A0Q3ESN4_BRADI|nr:hypothetical protein BRADI_4g24655v3 [Brachypodium distachyon]
MKPTATPARMQACVAAHLLDVPCTARLPRPLPHSHPFLQSLPCISVPRESISVIICLSMRCCRGASGGEGAEPGGRRRGRALGPRSLGLRRSLGRARSAVRP